MRETSALYEAEVVEGIGMIAAEELSQIRGVSHLCIEYPRPDGIQFKYAGSPRRLLSLRCVHAVYAVLQFDIPRPKALLGDQHFRRLVGGIHQVMEMHPTGSFSTLGISAAGSDSSVMRRVRAELAAAARLETSDDKGDLLVRIRRISGGSGWECLIRLTPRPLATRSWRVRNYEGALNATVAQAMARLTRPKPDDVLVNLGCGSGSLLIERLSVCSARVALGVEKDPIAIEAARKNLAAAGYNEAQHLVFADATQVPFPSNAVTAILADMPFGHRVGSHTANQLLYPAVLSEAARLARAGTHFVMLTHEIHMMETLLQRTAMWRLHEQIPICLRGLHPRIYVLQRL